MVQFRKSFGAWWNLWKDSARIRDPKEDKDRKEWSDMVSPGRLQNIEEWMRNTGYTGMLGLVLGATDDITLLTTHRKV